MIFERWRKPKWQHRNPDIRRREIEKMTDADAVILTQIVCDDENAGVRRLALRRTSDLDLLWRRISEDEDINVRAQAMKRFRQLLAGLAEDAPSLDERVARTKSLTEQGELHEFLAREAVEPEIRAAAVVRIDNEAFLGDIALKDAAASIRLAALERIELEPTLKRVLKGSRGQDKNVRRRAQEKLDKLRAERERPSLIKAKCGEICTVMENLGKGARWERDQDIAEQQEHLWQSLDALHRQEFEERYKTAKAAFAGKLAKHNEEIAAREREFAPIRDEAAALRARMTAVARSESDQTPPAEQTISDETTPREGELAHLQREARTCLERCERLPSEEQIALRREMAPLQERIDVELADIRGGRSLSSLCGQCDALLDSNEIIDERKVRALAKRRPVLDGASPTVQKLSTQLEEKLSKLNDRIKAQQQKKADWLNKLPDNIAALEKALDAGELNQAVSMRDRVQATLRNLESMSTPKQQLSHAKQQLHKLNPRLMELRTWRRFGSDSARERLCEELETLADSDASPPERAKQIRDARERWKRLGKDDPSTSHALRRRFDAAAERAYEPCRAYFEAQAKSRDANLEKRSAICRRLDEFIQQADWQTIDWKSAVRTRRDVMNDWRAASPVDRRAEKRSSQELNASLAVLDKELDKERKKNRGMRERLIEQADALKAAEDPKAAAAECAQLQKQWRPTVPGRRQEEQALWERFKASCDDVFARRQEVFDEQRGEWNENLKLKAGICEQIETLTECDRGGIDEAKRTSSKLSEQWSQIGSVSKRDESAIAKRFAKAREQFEKHCANIAQDKKSRALETLNDRAKLCHSIEEQVRCGNVDPDTASQARARWEAFGECADATARALAKRFEQACSAAANEEGSRDQLQAASPQNRTRREELCLQLEVLSGVDSPPEQSEARMALQVSRLSEALSQGKSTPNDEFDGLVKEWYTTGPAMDETAASLEQRFQLARSAFAKTR